VDPMDIVTLVISKHMGAETMGEYSFEEFDKGFKDLGVQSINELKGKLPSLYSELEDPSKFKEIYKFTFDFTRDQGYKNIQVETAIALWELLLSK
jgi:DCN1-like protein 1/2